MFQNLLIILLALNGEKFSAFFHCDDFMKFFIRKVVQKFLILYVEINIGCKRELKKVTIFGNQELFHIIWNVNYFRIISFIGN